MADAKQMWCAFEVQGAGAWRSCLWKRVHTTHVAQSSGSDFPKGLKNPNLILQIVNRYESMSAVRDVDSISSQVNHLCFLVCDCSCVIGLGSSHVMLLIAHSGVRRDIKIDMFDGSRLMPAGVILHCSCDNCCNAVFVHEHTIGHDLCSHVVTTGCYL